jgi:putative hydrolase of the HAD superfamily
VAERSDGRQAVRGDLRGVIIDWGGVLTSPIIDSVNAWLDAEMIDRAVYRRVMRAWVEQAYRDGGADNPIHQLERGDGDPAEFEGALAAQLVRTDGTQVPATGLLARMFAGTLPVPAMYDLIRAVRRAGFRTCLLSNSWGADWYDRTDFPDLFDGVVISCEVGMRKPEPEIFQHAAELIGLPPAACVFVDDVEANIVAAEAIGMTGVHHSDPAITTERVAALLGFTFSHI